MWLTKEIAHDITFWEPRRCNYCSPLRSSECCKVDVCGRFLDFFENSFPSCLFDDGVDVLFIIARNSAVVDL